jgi:hypothetical protein
MKQMAVWVPVLGTKARQFGPATYLFPDRARYRSFRHQVDRGLKVATTEGAEILIRPLSLQQPISCQNMILEQQPGEKVTA